MTIFACATTARSEVLTTLCIVVSYLGWVSAQIKALGLVFNVVTDGAVPQLKSV